uniref:NB-ARC domain-containing protein n=1 Tax=Salix viminalis TaxID=40686 RepID=A0A6N2KU56_SALVM
MGGAGASKDFSIHKLQNKIAKHIELSFFNEEDELGNKVAELSQELMKKQRWIFILDYLWNSFKPHGVGIPDSLIGCKLIITTRSEAKNNVSVNPLSREEAMNLFKPLSPQVEQIARDITRECVAFPLGIQTIVGTMKGSNVLEDLNNQKFCKVEEVFRILRFSYTHLSDKAIHQCFLFCGLFHEDFVIPRDLIDYLIDKGVVKGKKSREEEINKGHIMLDRIEKTCLLERLYGGNDVTMHDLIRDMAIQILEDNSQAIC